MGKILFLFTGGTIGSTAGDAFIAPDAEKPRKLLAAYGRQYGLRFAYETSEPFTILSENSSGSTLYTLIESARAAVLSRKYDGIIVTHGTDTLQYSAAALSYALGLSEIPVLLVSANLPIENAASNGVRNLHAALCFLNARPKDCRGVWVAYQNGTALPEIHRASRLLAHSAFSDQLCSIAPGPFGTVSEGGSFTRNPAYTERPNETDPIVPPALHAEEPGLLRIVPSPGLVYPALSENVRAILHESYHSGTLNLESASARAFFKDAAERKIPVFLSGTMPGVPYESARDFDRFGIIPLPGRAPIALYMKLWLCLAANRPLAETMRAVLGGEA